eukprot:gene2912-biopygen11740
MLNPPALFVQHWPGAGAGTGVDYVCGRGRRDLGQDCPCKERWRKQFVTVLSTLVSFKKLALSQIPIKKTADYRRLRIFIRFGQRFVRRALVSSTTRERVGAADVMPFFLENGFKEFSVRHNRCDVGARKMHQRRNGRVYTYCNGDHDPAVS